MKKYDINLGARSQNPNDYLCKGNNKEYMQSKGKDQESIQSSTTPDQGHHMGKWQKHKKTQHTREPRGQPFPSRFSQGCKEQTR